MQRAQPPSIQFFTPAGVPLYPVEIIFFSLTIIAPFAGLIQLDRVATTSAIFIKYSSQEGLWYFVVFLATFFIFKFSPLLLLLTGAVHLLDILLRLLVKYLKSFVEVIYITSTPMLRAEPATMLMAPASSFEFKSTIFFLAISKA